MELYKRVTPADRLLITIVVMSATLMQVIDTTIVNVALPHMQGSLGASSDEITWTLTSYLVSSAIFMPLTGYFADRFGRKNYLLISIGGFTIASVLCGASVTLTEIVIFRLLQGVFGAGLVPLSQAILADIFPPEDRGKAMAIWGMGVMVGPILGPTLGGYLTDVSTWRWTFYVNVPVGFFTLLLANVIPDSPKKSRQMDWVGLMLISIGIGGLQYVIDRGNQLDWFSSTEICIVSYLSLTGFLGFLLHNSQSRTHVVFDLKIFKDRNFAVASILLAVFGLGLYGMMVIQPLMMEGLLNYPALTTGLILAPRGICGMLSMLIIGKLTAKIDPRLFIITGILISIVGIRIGTFYSLNISPAWIIWPMCLQGFGLGMIFVPLSVIAYSTLPTHLRTEAAGLFSLLRTIGSSIGISIAVTLLTRRTQLFWNQLGGGIQLFNEDSINHYLAPLGLTSDQPVAIAILSNELYRQAEMLSFINVFDFIMWCFVLMIPLVMLLKKGKKVEPIVPKMD